MSRFAYNHPDAIQLCTQRICDVLQSLSKGKKVICVCIGTDRSTGDALGPLVGTLLSKKTVPGVTIKGTLEKPVHAMNLQETMQQLHQQPNSIILAIDACLGKAKNIGMIQIGSGPIKPGAGVNKDLPPVGQIHITGIVNVAGLMEFLVLQNTRLHIVMQMAEVISTSLYSAFQRLHGLENPAIQNPHSYPKSYPNSKNNRFI